MPRLSRAESLVVQISSQAQTDTEGVPYPPSAGLGTNWHDFASANSWVVERQCLGAAELAPETSSGAGVPVAFEVMQAFGSNHLADVDRVEILPAAPGECVAPGPVPNGDAEGSGGWSFAIGAASDGTFAGFAPAVGANGSQGARLYVQNVCDFASLALPFSVPASDQLTSPALSFYIKGTPGETVALSRYGSWAFSISSSQPQTIVGCLPAPLRGELATLTTSVAAGGTCGNPAGLEAVVDDVALIDDPGCGTDPGIADPGFESTHLPFGVSYQPGISTAQLTVDPAQAHSGVAALRLAGTVTCGSSVWSTVVVPPSPSSAGGGALEFYYRATPVNHYALQAFGSGGLASVIQDGTWRRGVMCFDSKFAGRPQSVELDFLGTGTCNVTVPEEFVYLDDLALINDPTCP
jgi:hypothetical protein